MGISFLNYLIMMCGVLALMTILTLSLYNGVMILLDELAERGII